jgi:hypothetical protein
MTIRKIVSTVLITALLFGSLPAGRALAGANPMIHPAAPAATSHVITGWFWGLFACPASIIVSGVVANFRDNRQLTYWEAWTCGLAFWFAKPGPQQKPH